MEQEKLSNNKEIYHDTYPFDCHGNEMVYKKSFHMKKKKEKKMIIFESYIFTARPVA
jgi:hypothetical protein